MNHRRLEILDKRLQQTHGEHIELWESICNERNELVEQIIAQGDNPDPDLVQRCSELSKISQDTLTIFMTGFDRIVNEVMTENP